MIEVHLLLGAHYALVCVYVATPPQSPVAIESTTVDVR